MIECSGSRIYRMYAMTWMLKLDEAVSFSFFFFFFGGEGGGRNGNALPLLSRFFGILS